MKPRLAMWLRRQANRLDPPPKPKPWPSLPMTMTTTPTPTGGITIYTNGPER